MLTAFMKFVSKLMCIALVNSPVCHRKLTSSGPKIKKIQNGQKKFYGVSNLKDQILIILSFIRTCNL